MYGGEIDKEALVNSFSKIKEDIARLNDEIIELKREHKKVLEENIELKKQLKSDSVETIIKKTVSAMQTDAKPKRSNKKRRRIITNRIRTLASKKRLTLPDIKDVVVEQEGLCSKATFYRYVKKLEKKGYIDYMKIDDLEIVVNL